MTATRRILTLIGLTVTAIAGASLPASATYADTAAVATTIATGTVAAPATVTVNDYCVTTTTTVTSATITETLMPRRFGVMARWLPVHSLLSQSRRLAAAGVVANAVVAASCPSR